MKIAFLNKTYGKIYRGGETFTGELSNQLSKLGYEVKVFGGFKEFRVSGYKADIIIPVNGRLQTLATKIWCLLNNKKMVVSGQSGLGIDDKINLWCRPDTFVALTNFQTGWANKNGFGVKVKTIPNGVDLTKFTISKKNKENIILSVGALTKDKRQDLIIKAVSRLKNVSLVIVGKGSEKENLEKLGNELLPGRFEIKSFTHDQMPKVYQSAQLFTFTTVPWESFGIVMLEAMATNLPVVVSDDPIRKEIIGDAGFTVNVENTTEFAEKIKEALKINWGDKPIEQAKKFSWDKIAEKYDQLFRNLTGL